MSILRFTLHFPARPSLRSAIPTQRHPYPSCCRVRLASPQRKRLFFPNSISTGGPEIAEGTSLQVASSRESDGVGEPIHGRIVEPVYALDQLVPSRIRDHRRSTKIDGFLLGNVLCQF
jgi:hypothetical protein